MRSPFLFLHCPLRLGGLSFFLHSSTPAKALIEKAKEKLGNEALQDIFS